MSDCFIDLQQARQRGQLSPYYPGYLDFILVKLIIMHGISIFAFKTRQLMKRILIINEFYHPFIGGMEIRFKRIAERMVDSDNEVDVICVGHINDLPSEDKINGVNITRLINDPNYYKKGVFGRRLTTMVKFYFAIKNFLKGKSYDIVIIGQFVLLPLINSKKLFNKSETVFIDFVEYRFSSLWKLLNGLILSAVDKVSCVSDSVKKTVLERHPKLNAQNVISIRNSVNMDDFESQSDEHMVFIGRLETHKNPEKAIESVLQFNKTNEIPNKYKMHVLGGGTLLNSLKQKYENNKEVIIHGFVSESKKKEVLSNARLMVFPSDREGLPGVFIEALASNLPILTTNGINNNSKDFIIQEKVGEVTGTSIEEIVEGIKKIEKNRSYYLNQIEKVKSRYDLDNNILKFFN